LIDGKRGIVANDRRQARQERPAVRTPLDTRFLVPHLTAISTHERPDQNGNPCNRYDDALCHEQPPQIVGMHAQERHAHQPEQEKANHRIRLDALVFADRILQRQETRPYSANHDSHLET
jgi:hypothetical protein